MWYADEADVEPWQPHPDLFEPRMRWRSGGITICDGVDLARADEPASFACETCAAPYCADRRALRIRALGEHALLLPASGALPRVLEDHGAVLVAGRVWRELGARFPDLAAPLRPATRADALEAWISTWPLPRSTARELADRVLAARSLDVGAARVFVRGVEAWAHAAPHAPVETFPADDPELVWLDDEAREWSGLCFDPSHACGIRLGPIGVLVG